MKNLLILGCGWVGEELAQQYLKKGWQVWATTTSQEKYHRLIGDGIFAYTHNFDTDLNLDLPVDITFDAVVTSIPATQRQTIEEIRHRFYHVFNVLSAINYSKHIYLSSVGVYPDEDGVFDETYANEDRMNAKLRLAEKQMMSLPYTLTFRLGGLFGKKRIFGKYFENKVVTTGDQPANFVHLDDVVSLLSLAIAGDIPVGYYNVVAPEHPSKKEVILKSAEKYMYDYPSAFTPQDSFQKIVRGEKLATLFNYAFKYPSPLDF